MIFRQYWVVVLLMLSIGSGAMALEVVDLRVDQRHQPIGIDNPHPVFSWKLRSSQPATLQSAYEIEVSHNGDTVWRSERRESRDSLYVNYEGPALNPMTRYQWRVRVVDNHGQTSPWSQAAFWETGLIAADDWVAPWITYPWQEDVEKSPPSPLFRKVFSGRCPVEKARLLVTSLGVYEAYINGAKVGDAYFTPGWTSYDHRLQYQVYDVTDQLATGDNVLAVRLGDGWYRGNMGWENQRNLYGDRLALKAELRLTCEDGSEQRVQSDTSWQVTTGYLVSSDIYNGELQDFRKAKTDALLPGYASDDWVSAVPFAGETPALVDTQSEPVRVMHEINPKMLLSGPGGETIVDMGQNMVGWVRLNVSGKAGQELILRHAEVLKQDGSLYHEALRSARQEMRYILAEDGEVTLQPVFSFQGFRYVSIEGASVDLEDITGVVLYSDMPQTNRFTSSHPMLNQLQSNILWGQRGNFLEVPTDCPQRDERMGWTGDAQVFARTALFNTDSAAFFRRWLADVRADQFNNGGIPFVVPDVLTRHKVTSFAAWWLSRENSASGWGDVIIELPSALYERTGDLQALATNYEAMKRWVEYERAGASAWWATWTEWDNWKSAERRKADRYIWNGAFTFGDWLAPVQLSSTFVNTVYFARSTHLLAKAAEALGKQEDAEHYKSLWENIRQAFQARYWTEENRLSEDIQGGYVLALQFDMLDAEQADSAAARLNALVRERGNHMATGFLSTPYILPVLTRYGYLDTAYALLLQENHPSWLYPITKGATTIWERWGSIQPDGSFGDEGMNSFNHYAYGAVGDWIYQTVAGIQAVEPGYRRILFAPQPGGGLSHAGAVFDSPYGEIASHWRVEEGRLLIELRVPPNTEAEFILPKQYTNLGLQGGDASGLLDLGGERVILGSGHYHFAAEQLPTR